MNLELITHLQKDFLTMKYCPISRFLWNEWNGFIPSSELRDAMIYACEFILEKDIELILADFTKICAPTLNDQVWIATHTAKLLQNSKLRKVANLHAHDFFSRMAIESIYEKASVIPLPIISKDFITKQEGLEWLFDGKRIVL